MFNVKLMRERVSFQWRLSCEDFENDEKGENDAGDPEEEAGDHRHQRVHVPAFLGCYCHWLKYITLLAS